MDQVKKFVRNVKEVALDYDDVQLRVRDATSNDPVGADERLMARIAHDTRDHQSYNSMFSIMWKRITDLHQPSHILKALILSDYLLIHGDERFVRDLRTKKNVVKRLTGYKFYRNHEDIGGEVRTQARKVLELLINDAPLEEMRKYRKGDITKVASYQRNHGHDEFSDNSYPDSPGNRQIRNGGLTTEAKKPTHDAYNTTTTPSLDIQDSKRAVTEIKKKKKEKKIKARKPSQETNVNWAGPSDYSMRAPRPDIDLLTGSEQPVAPVDWFAMSFNNGDQSQQQQPSFPALSFKSGDDIFVGTPIDPATPHGTPDTDGFAFDDTLEIGSDDDTDKGFWNIDKKLVDVSDLRAHAPAKKAPVVTGSAPGKTLAEIAASNRNPAPDLMIHPLPSQTQRQAQNSTEAPTGYGYSEQFHARYGSGPQAMGHYQQQPQYGMSPMGVAYPMAPMPNTYPAQGPMAPFPQQNQHPASYRLQKQSSAPADPFASLWKQQQ